MMGRTIRNRGLIAFLFAVAGMGLAGTGTAAASFEHSDITLNGTHGYHLEIVGNNQPFPFGGGGNFVGFTTHKNPHAYAAYDTAGKSTAKRLVADFGDFGKVDLTFHPKDVTHPPLPGPHCHGLYKVTFGVWKGIFKFKGENGYTKASAKKLDGKYVVNDVTCRGGHTNHTHVQLSAQSGATNFTADVRKKASATPSFSVFDQSVVGAVYIFRTIGLRGDAKDFSYNGSYTKATVKPPSPFSGKGVYDSGLWTGTLQADMPGAPNTVLAGAGWSASLGEQNEKTLFDPGFADFGR
jgi:hypothetical protein